MIKFKFEKIKNDFNVKNYYRDGYRHLCALNTDFENATTSSPAQNTKQGWLSHLSGVYPIVTSKDFNQFSQSAGALYKTSGGPTQSGHYIDREISQAVVNLYPYSYRLRNWNLIENTGYKKQLYASFYFKTQSGADLGKLFRVYWDSNKAVYPKSSNFWISVKADGTFAARVEGPSDGHKPLYTDKVFTPAELNNVWQRFEIMIDFENDKWTFLIDGKQMTDISNNYFGWVFGQIGVDRVLDYALLGNTVDARIELGQSFAWSQPYADYTLQRIEVADSDQWSQKTISAVQTPIAWDLDLDGSYNVTCLPNLGMMGSLDGKYLYYVDGTDATLIGPVADFMAA